MDWDLELGKMATTSNGDAEAEKSSSIDGGEKTQTVPLLKLFSFADSTDVALMIVGTVGAIASGLGMPLMTILFGEMINSFGNNQSGNTDIVNIISKVNRKCTGQENKVYFNLYEWKDVTQTSDFIFRYFPDGLNFDFPIL